MADGAIEQIKAKLDIVQEIGAVVALRPGGKAYKGLCPFHNERTPSFHVFPDSRTWRCFGCNEGGDIFSFVTKQQGIDFGEALKLLAEKAGVPLTDRLDEPFESSGQSQARARLRALNDAAAVWFHHQLLTSPGAAFARSYLQSRGMNTESIERFRLGYAPEGDQLTRYLLSQDFTAEELIDAGLARRRDADKGGALYDYFRNRLVFTIRSSQNQVIGFGARELGGGTPKYLNSPQTLLFDKSSTLYALDQAREGIKKQDEVVVVEGYVDAVIAHQYGYRNTVAIIGSAITAKHVQQLKKLTRRLVLALDPDAAGEAATLRAIEVAQEAFDTIAVPVAAVPRDVVVPSSDDRAQKKKNAKLAQQAAIRFEEQSGADIYVLQVPDELDPDEYIRLHTTEWGDLVRKAQPLLDYFFTALVAGLNMQNPADQAEAGRRLFPVLATVGERIKQDAYTRRLASLLRIPERDAQMELQRYRRQHLAKYSSQAGGTSPASVGEKYQTAEVDSAPDGLSAGPLEQRANAGFSWEDHCLGLVLSHPSVAPEVCVILEASDFWGTETRALFTLLASPGGPRTPVAVEALLATQPEILRTTAERLRARFDAQPALDRTNLARTAKQIAYRLKRLRLSDAITEISYLRHDAETNGERETARDLLMQSLRLHQQRRDLDAALMLQG